MFYRIWNFLFGGGCPPNVSPGASRGNPHNFELNLIRAHASELLDMIGSWFDQKWAIGEELSEGRALVDYLLRELAVYKTVPKDGDGVKPF